MRKNQSRQPRRGAVQMLPVCAQHPAPAPAWSRKVQDTVVLPATHTGAWPPQELAPPPLNEAGFRTPFDFHITHRISLDSFFAKASACDAGRAAAGTNRATRRHDHRLRVSRHPHCSLIPLLHLCVWCAAVSRPKRSRSSSKGENNDGC